MRRPREGRRRALRIPRPVALDGSRRSGICSDDGQTLRCAALDGALPLRPQGPRALNLRDRFARIPVDDRSAADRLAQGYEQLLARPHARLWLWPGKDERPDTHGNPIRGLGDSGDAGPLGRTRIDLDGDRPLVDHAVTPYWL